jgi:hypothetical protein
MRRQLVDDLALAMATVELPVAEAVSSLHAARV